MEFLVDIYFVLVLSFCLSLHVFVKKSFLFFLYERLNYCSTSNATDSEIVFENPGNRLKKKK